MAASLNHPNVIPIYDMGSQDDLLYIAMRYVSGTDMRQMIKKRGRILPATALFLVGQAARALDAAHRKGLVHRDVKPGNLLIERGSDEADPDHVYLADFGITKHAMSRSGLTSTGQFLGTIDYVAPEQIRGTSVMGQAARWQHLPRGVPLQRKRIKIHIRAVADTTHVMSKGRAVLAGHRRCISLATHRAPAEAASLQPAAHSGHRPGVIREREAATAPISDMPGTRT